MSVRAAASSFARSFAGSLACLAVLGACISSNPPPTVRYFDPLPEVESVAARGLAVDLVVTGAPQLAPDFALRVGPREVAFDSDVRWTAAPRDLVLAALERALFRGAFARGGENAVQLTVHVAVFELDLVGKPTATLELEVARGAGPVRPVRKAVPAASREPRDLAAAMAEALAGAVIDVRDSIR